jgi:hypothetical protein
MALYGSSGMREVKARKAYACENCGGTIDRGEIYYNYHSEQTAGNWQGRQHMDCEAAWWQGDTTHLLSAVALLPGEQPPTSEKDPVLADIPFSVTGNGTQVHVSVSFCEAYREKLLHTRNLDIRREAFVQIGRAQALTADCLVAVSGNLRKAKQMSHLLQQMAQVAGIQPYRS